MPRAARLADELLSNYQHVITDLTLIPGGGGTYDVIINDDLVYSKKETKRHAEDGEVFGMFQKLIGPEVPIYGT